MIKTDRLSNSPFSISFGVDECIFPFPLFVFLLPLTFSLFLLSSTSYSERVRGVWVYGVSPCNRYRKRNRNTAAGRDTEVENTETKETDIERRKDKENRRRDGFGDGGSWHLTVKHAFLMRALVLCTPILRSLSHAEPRKQMKQER